MSQEQRARAAGRAVAIPVGRPRGDPVFTLLRNEAEDLEDLAGSCSQRRWEAARQREVAACCGVGPGHGKVLAGTLTGAA